VGGREGINCSEGGDRGYLDNKDINKEDWIGDFH